MGRSERRPGTARYAPRSHRFASQSTNQTPTLDGRMTNPMAKVPASRANRIAHRDRTGRQECRTPSNGGRRRRLGRGTHCAKAQVVRTKPTANSGVCMDHPSRVTTDTVVHVPGRSNMGEPEVRRSSSRGRGRRGFGRSGRSSRCKAKSRRRPRTPTCDRLVFAPRTRAGIPLALEGR